jgi:signal transduction histidine kinase
MRVEAKPCAAPDGAQLAALQERVAQLEQSQAELEAFAHAVSHELRTPLSAANSFCSLLQEALAALPGEPARISAHYASRVHMGLQHMGQLTEALVTLARASRASLRMEAVDLSLLAREVIDGLQSRDPGRECQFQVQPGLQDWGDRALLRQVLENLLGNAWKFSVKQALVNIEFGRQPPHEGGAYFVRDRGVGFDMAQVSRLFQNFQRLHSGAEFPGSGIGLSLVKRIVASHGGGVRAQSSPGQGATFFFTLGALLEGAHPQAKP